MHAFTHGEVDILLCTSIIESGLDIPNANTLIVDRGDTFGLAQLYQLRGRVGRGAHRAYAYFFRHKRRMPTSEGQERLEVIAENTQLGAGYSIAMRDLEMRGAGDLLGTRQSGFIAAVGFHLYTRMLAQSVRQLRGSSEVPGLIEKTSAFRGIRSFTSVDLPLSIGIPMEYISDQNLRLAHLSPDRRFVERGGSGCPGGGVPGSVWSAPGGGSEPAVLHAGENESGNERACFHNHGGGSGCLSFPTGRGWQKWILPCHRSMDCGLVKIPIGSLLKGRETGWKSLVMDSLQKIGELRL